MYYYNNKGKFIAKRNIISLTTFPARINTVHHVVRTLLSQTVPADMVVLWLAPELFLNREADLPQNLLELVANGLSIEWCPDIKSYKKLVPALQKFPNDNIITVDDDVLYPANMLAELIKTHNKYPDDICAHRDRGTKSLPSMLARPRILYQRRHNFTL